MSWTLTDLQTAIANEVDQSDTYPTIGGDDWNIRMNLINRAIQDWGNTYEWKALLKVHNGRVTTAGFATYGLPTDFQKIDGYPVVTWDGETTDSFPVIDPTKYTQYNDSDRYTYVLGNDRDSKTLYIHASTLCSGASVQFTYYASPASLASPTNVTECPDPNYIVQRSLYLIYKGREDGRFPEAKVEADRMLARMIENENVLGQAHNDNRVQRWEESRYAFRIGRD